MCLRCHERQRQKQNQAFWKFFKNQYGQSVWALEERVNKKNEVMKVINMDSWRITKNQIFSLSKSLIMAQIERWRQA